MKRITTLVMLAMLIGGICASGAHATSSRGADCAQCHSFSNQPPVANAGLDQTVASGTTVSLSGIGSSDPDDGIASYTWSQIDGPTVTLSNAASANPTFTAPQVSTAADLTFQLTVADKSGQSSTDTCAVSVDPAGTPTTNAPPVADAGLDLAVLPGAFNNLEGFYSTDPDDGIATYIWEQTGGPAAALSSSTVADPIFLAPNDPATLTFRLTVTDKGGLQASDTCTVVVLSSDGGVQPPVDPPPDTGNQPPVANAGQDQTVRSGSKVKLSGTESTDADDGIASYQWRQVSGTSVRLSDQNEARSSFTAPRVTSKGETLTFELTVMDTAGQSSSDTVNVTVYRSSDDRDDDDDREHNDDGEHDD